MVNGCDSREVDCPLLRDYIRRKAASRMIALTFDDDLIWDNPRNPEYQLGAGPVVNFEDGIELGDDGFVASETLKIPDGVIEPRTYIPNVPLNARNSQQKIANLVSGTYDSNVHHGEDNDFHREDFPGSSSPDAAATADSFLARLARSSNTFTDQFQSGPPLPWLFGRMSLVQGGTKGLGLTVRATALASAGSNVLPNGTSGLDAGRVMSVGAPIVAVPELPGSSSMAISATAWNPQMWNSFLQADGTAVQSGGSVELTVNSSSGELTALQEIFNEHGVRTVQSVSVGFLFVATPSETNAAAGRQIGEFVTPGLGLVDQGGYAAIISVTIPGATPAAKCIIAFGGVDADLNARPIQVRRIPDLVAAGNATSTLSFLLNPALDSDQRSLLFTEHRAVSNPLRVPVLVR